MTNLHAPSAPSGRVPVFVALEELVPNAENPRDSLGELDELGASIVSLGLLQPLLVVALDEGGFMVVDGHRRHAAMCSVGYARPVPVVVVEMDERERLVAAVAAGSFARALSHIEQAKAFQKLRELGMTQGEIAEQVGVHQVTVSTRLKLLLLSAEQQQAVHEGRMSAKVALDEARKVKVFRPRGRSVTKAKLTVAVGDLCETCGQPKPPEAGSSHVQRPLVLACDDCTAEFPPDRVGDLNRHCISAHQRRASAGERTPVAA